MSLKCCLIHTGIISQRNFLYLNICIYVYLWVYLYITCLIYFTLLLFNLHNNQSYILIKTDSIFSLTFVFFQSKVFVDFSLAFLIQVLLIKKACTLSWNHEWLRHLSYEFLLSLTLSRSYEDFIKTSFGPTILVIIFWSFAMF